MELLLLTRHGRSVLNVAGVVNGDPALDKGLAREGEDQARRLGMQIIGLTIDACVTSAFPRAHQTAQLALGARAATTPTSMDTDLDDVRIGQLEGGTLDDYRAWKHGRPHSEPFPGGESLDDAAQRYADAYERLVRRPEPTILCVCHEIPVRYAVNAALGSDELDAPAHDIANATPYLFDADALSRAVVRLRELAR